MTISEIVKQSKETGAVLIRYRAESHKQTGTAQYDCKPPPQQAQCSRFTMPSSRKCRRSMTISHSRASLTSAGSE